MSVEWRQDGEGGGNGAKCAAAIEPRRRSSRRAALVRQWVRTLIASQCRAALINGSQQARAFPQKLSAPFAARSIRNLQSAAIDHSAPASRPLNPSKYLSMLLLTVVCALGALTSAQHFEKAKSVWIEQGLVRGRIYKLGEKHMQIFRGIPYAEPPVGDLRFRVSRQWCDALQLWRKRGGKRSISIGALFFSPMAVDTSGYFFLW